MMSGQISNGLLEIKAEDILPPDAIKQAGLNPKQVIAGIHPSQANQLS
jgi:hypothetical protein